MRQAGRIPAELEQPEGLLQPRAPVPARPETGVLVLGTPPLTEPIPGVCIDRPVGIADRAEAELISPATHNMIEFRYALFDPCQACPTACQLADPLTDAFDAFP